MSDKTELETIENKEIVAVEEKTDEEPIKYSRLQTSVDPEVIKKLDEHLLRVLDQLWIVATDQRHPDHKRLGFEAMKLILRHVAPVRKEIVIPPPPPPPAPPAPPAAPVNDMALMIGALFKGDSTEKKPIDITPDKNVDKDI